MMNQKNVLPKKYKEYFNQVFMLEVSEYLFNPIMAFNNVNKLLKKGGYFWLSFHFLYPIHNPEGQDMIRYTKWGIEKLLKETGFKIESIIPRLSKNSKLKSFYVNEGMRPCKTYDGHEEVGYLVKARKL